MRSPYEVVKKRHVTEKARVMEELATNESNRSVAAFECPKYVFLVHPSATKPEIKAALEEIYREKKIRVVGVNTLRVKPKQKRRGRGRKGATSGLKKAIVTFEKGDQIDEL